MEIPWKKTPPIFKDFQGNFPVAFLFEDLNRLVKELQPKLKAPEEVHLQVLMGWWSVSPMASQKWPVFFGMERSLSEKCLWNFRWKKMVRFCVKDAPWSMCVFCCLLFLMLCLEPQVWSLFLRGPCLFHAVGDICQAPPCVFLGTNWSNPGCLLLVNEIWMVWTMVKSELKQTHLQSCGMESMNYIMSIVYIIYGQMIKARNLQHFLSRHEGINYLL